MANWKVLTIVSIIFGLGFLIAVIVLFAVTGPKIPFDYGIVLDAGSSHTQVTLYQWLSDKIRYTGVVKEIDTRTVIGDGISSYENANNVGNYLLPDVLEVSKIIDSNRLSKTQIYLGATAGMRLLNMTDHIKSMNTFNSIKETFRLKTDFKTKTIGIISGQDEGLFAWIAANYLTDKLIVDQFDERSQKSAYGVLDMGGASAQIAYRLTEDLYNKSVATDDHVQVRLYGTNHTVKASSNLCFGADQARLRFWNILILDNSGNRPIDNPCLHKGQKETIPGSTFKDQICLERKDKKTIDTLIDYTFVGIGDSDKCEKIISSQLLNVTQCESTFTSCFTVSISPPPNETLFFAVSNYWYSTRIINITQPISMKEFKMKMDNFCTSNAATIESYLKSIINPNFKTRYCFNLQYVYGTLKNVYKFNDISWNNVNFADTINDAQLGWSLGFMINATNAIPSEKPSRPIIETVYFIFICVLCTVIVGFGIYFGFKWRGKRNVNDKQINETVNYHA